MKHVHGLHESVRCTCGLTRGDVVVDVKKLTLERLGKELGVDPEVILATSHGRRSIDTLKLYDESLANWECELC